MSAIDEMGQQPNIKHLYINCLTDDEVFGHAQESIILNILKDFQKHVRNLNILNIIGEVKQKNSLQRGTPLKNYFLFKEKLK